MAFLVIGSPIIVQLHCNGPTGKVSRISAGLGAFMGGPDESILNRIPAGFSSGSPRRADTPLHAGYLTSIAQKQWPYDINWRYF
jgi:hypothetical protein